MLIKNIHLENSPEPVDIYIKDGKFEKIGPNLLVEAELVIDGTDRLALPQFIDSHVHLDSALTAGQPRWNLTGTLFEGIQCWSEYKPSLTKDNLKQRVLETLRRMAKNGIGHVRTHVDVTDPTLIATEGLLEVREEVKDWIDLQIVAFPQEGILSFPNGKQLMENAAKMGVDAIGAIPHFEFTREYAVESLDFAVALADKYDLLVDVHCDEIDDEQSRGLEVLAARAYESGLKDRVTASHTTAMHSYNNAYTSKLFRLLKLSQINFVANPLINIHLQGRFDSYPKRRGMTRVKELVAAGINVSFGHDDIFDPWYPLGDGNMRDPVHMGLHVAQMMGYEEIMNAYRFITYNAAKTLHLGEDYGIAEGRDASFIILNAKNFYDALNLKSEVLYNFTKGRLIAETKPAKTEIYF
ncbi:MAG TPA: cytosine deaminase [Tissierellia bacterium]|nr:cytosine deaminase [Tissierellia bacterium]